MKYANISFKFRFDVCEVTTCRSGDFQTNTKTKEKEKYMYSGYELIWLFFLYQFFGLAIGDCISSNKTEKIYPNALKVE